VWCSTPGRRINHPSGKSAARTTLNPVCSGVSVGPDGAIWITGAFHEEITLDEGETTEVKLNMSANAVYSLSGYLAKYNADGSLIWAKMIPILRGRATIVSDDGTAVLIGAYKAPAVFNEGEEDSFTLDQMCYGSGWDIFFGRFDENGDVLWVKKAGGIGSDSIMDIAPSEDGSFVVAGQFEAGCTFGLGEPNNTTLDKSGADYASDIYIAKYNQTGELLWVKSAGGPGITATIGFSQESVGGISVDTTGSIVATGDFNVSATFGSGEPNETLLITTGGDEIYIAKFLP
jgi:hypothetical protein